MRPATRLRGALTVDKAGKVFARPFQKAAQSRARSPRRRPQTAKLSYRRFLFAKLFLCAYMVKEKASFSFTLFGDDNSFCLQPVHPPSRPPNACEAAPSENHLPPEITKLPPRAPAPNKTNQIFALHGRVLLGEVLGERGRFGGREPRLSRGGSLPPRSSPATSKIFRRCSQKRLVFFRKVRYHIE